ncbi:hypothetical protein HMPREF0507_02198 [Lactobacillus crispatus MV-1A-US]|nr:hypothetical protein HMPREF0507_02198 [Lactobacillus crispatus MV-1A-US]
MNNQEKAYLFIKDQINTGHFKPGHRNCQIFCVNRSFS